MCTNSSSSSKKHSRQKAHNGWVPPSMGSLSGCLFDRCGIEGRCDGSTLGGYNACSCANTFLDRIHKSLCATSTTDTKRGSKEEKKGYLPKHLSVHGARVELEIAPSRRGIVTFGVWTVESEEDERFLHHVLGLEKDVELGVFVRDQVGRVGCKGGVGRGGEYDRRLGLLTGRSDVEASMRGDAPCKTYTRASCTARATAAHTRGMSGGCTRTGNST